MAEQRGQRVVLARNLLATLRGRELAQAAKGIAAETGLEHRPVADGQRVAGIYRRSVMLASGRYAMLDDGVGFSLVPWKPVIEQRMGQQLAATVHGGGLSWEIGRQRGPLVSQYCAFQRETFCCYRSVLASDLAGLIYSDSSPFRFAISMNARSLGCA